MLMEEIGKKIDRLLLMQRSIKGKNDEMVKPGEIVYFTLVNNQCVAVLENTKQVEMSSSMNFYEKYFGDFFLKVHRSFLVAVDRIQGFFERYPDLGNSADEKVLPEDSLKYIGIERLFPKAAENEETRSRKKGDECEISLRGTTKKIPVTEVYSKKLKKMFGLKSFSYLLPEHPHDRKLRQLGLIDFGWRELDALDAGNAKAVEAFKKKWDVKQFSKNRMLSYFRQYGANVLNKKRAIKNIIYQMHRWIMKGIEPKCDGNIRSMWYKVKTVLARHSDILTNSDVDTFYATLQEMVEVEELCRYKDFGFMDMNEPYRGIGSKRPEVVLASEKRGHYIFIRRLANEAGVSFVCMNGEPAVLSLEYFSDDLKNALEPVQEGTTYVEERSAGARRRRKTRTKRDSENTVSRKPLTVLCISDVDPAGYSIENSLVSGLRRNGHQVEKVVKLVDANAWTDDEIEIVRYPAVSYELKEDGTIVPVAPATMSQVTKGRLWWESIGSDPRLIGEKVTGGRKIVTIYGIESDAAEREDIKDRFLKELGATL